MGLFKKVPEHTFTEGQREADYDPRFPSGWYRLMALDELKPGEVRPLDCLGKNLVVYRGSESGRHFVMDAHCPHQGASLAQGSVDGDSIRCPFHGWCFGSNGRLESVPGLDKVPRTGVSRYPVREHYGMLWMWHDVSGEPCEPAYEPERVPAIDDGDMTFRGTHAVPDVRMHLSEFAENSVDFQHFAVVHGDLTLPWTQLKVPGFGVRHDPDWFEDEDKPHIAYFLDEACLTVRGKAYPQSGASARITLMGPGGTVWFHFSIPEVGNIVLFQTHLPRESLRQEIRFRYFADRKVPRPLVWWVIGHWISQWKADVSIWENKKFRPRPVLVKLDGPVHRMRRWYKQFYESGLETEGVGDASGLTQIRVPS